jgi:hypothetical protein
MDPTTAKPRRVFPRRVRNAVLTAHIMMSVGLLGDVAGFLAVAIRASSTTDQGSALHLIQVLSMFSVLFGIPLSVGAILTGITLGIGSKWGIFRYPWVVTKLLLIVSVMVVGGVIIGPALDTMRHGGGDTTAQLIAAASYDVVALAIATGLSVFKPGRSFRAGRTTGQATA